MGKSHLVTTRSHFQGRCNLDSYGAPVRELSSVVAASTGGVEASKPSNLLSKDFGLEVSQSLANCQSRRSK